MAERGVGFMGKNKTYPDIDMEQTGRRLQQCIHRAGFAVRDIQEYLHLSCPQPVYRWFKGAILPSVNHLFMLSKLLGMHMEELLVQRVSEDSSVMEQRDLQSGGRWRRMQGYLEYLQIQ